MDRLKGKVAIVTGASSGFGRGIAMSYAGEGASVVVSDIHEAPNQGGFEGNPQLTTAAAINEAGGKAQYIACDVTKQNQVANLVKETVRIYGGLDVMVNNAGIYRAGKLAHEFAVEDLDACSTSTSKAPGSVARKLSRYSCNKAVAATSSTSSRRRAYKAIRNSPSTTYRRVRPRISRDVWQSSTGVTKSG